MPIFFVLFSLRVDFVEFCLCEGALVIEPYVGGVYVNYVWRRNDVLDVDVWRTLFGIDCFVHLSNLSLSSVFG